MEQGKHKEQLGNFKSQQLLHCLHLKLYCTKKGSTSRNPHVGRKFSTLLCRSDPLLNNRVDLRSSKRKNKRNIMTSHSSNHNKSLHADKLIINPEYGTCRFNPHFSRARIVWRTVESRSGEANIRYQAKNLNISVGGHFYCELSLKGKTAY